MTTFATLSSRRIAFPIDKIAILALPAMFLKFIYFMDPLLLFALIAIIIVIGLIAELIFRRLGIPDVIFLLLLGLLIGPIAGLTSPEKLEPFAPIIAPIALLLLLFDSGLRLNIYRVLRRIPRATILSITSFAFTLCATMAVMSALGWGLYESAIFGAIIGGTSSATVISVTRAFRADIKSTLILESVISDVLCIVIALSLVKVYIFAEGDPFTPLRLLFAAFAVGIFFGGVAGIAWSRVLSVTPIPYEHIITIAIVFLLYSVSESLGGSGAVAAFVFGVFLGHSNEIARFFKMREIKIDETGIRKFQSEISFFVKTFFFVYLGLLFVVPSAVLVAVALAICALIYIVRYLSAKISMYGSRLVHYEAVLTLIAPRGLAAAVLAQITAAERPLPGGGVFPELTFIIIFATTAISAVASTIFGKIEKTERKK